MIIALIPARGGSKRIPRKNLEPIHNTPLVDFTINAACALRAYGVIDHVYLTSEDDEILNHARGWEAITVFRRHPSAATDDATDRDVVMDFLGRTQGDISLIVYLRPTTPFRLLADVEAAIQKMKDIPDASGLRSVHEMSESAHKCFEIDRGGQLMSLSSGVWLKYIVDDANLPNHLYPKTYHPNGVVDIMRPEIVRSGATFGSQVIAHITQPTIEIDTPWDFKLAQFELAIRQKEFREVWRP